MLLKRNVDARPATNPPTGIILTTRVFLWNFGDESRLGPKEARKLLNKRQYKFGLSESVYIQK